jgi:hypothetical protein
MVVPVKAITVKKKKSQRGPSCGGVRKIRIARPPHPKPARSIARGIIDVNDGKRGDSITSTAYLPPLYR